MRCFRPVLVVRDVALIAAGLVLIGLAGDSALRTFVLPRGAAVPLTRLVSRSVRRLFDLRVRFTSTYRARDRIMALYAPVTLFVLVGSWLVLVLGGFALVFEGVLGKGWREAFIISGSSVFTLGFDRPAGVAGAACAFAASAIGLGLLALLIAYIPTLYTTFSRREVLVAQLATRAGTPASPVELLQRVNAIGALNQLDELWIAWQTWFAELEESHTSLAYLVFFRSPTPDRSWVTAAGVVLDTAALVNSTVDVPRQPRASLCIRAGFTALRAIADFFGIPYDDDPRPDDPISVAREEWEDACRALEASGVPLRADRDQAWRDFAGWRVNYDVVLVTIAGLIRAPYGLWSSDRSIPFRPRVPRPALLAGLRRRRRADVPE